MVNEILHNLGLSSKEIAVYLNLLQHGKLTAGQITIKTKLKRTTVYSVLEELLIKKLINKDLGGKVESYYANPPEKLNVLFEEEEQVLRKKKELAKRAALELTQLGGNAVFSVPKITFAAGKDVAEFLYKATDKWNKSILQYDQVMWGFSNPTYVQEFSDYIEWYWQHTSSSVELKLFSADAEVERKFSTKYPRRQIKTWPGPKRFNSTLIICGDYIVMEYTDAEPYYLIEIYDKPMADNLRELFKVIWNLIP
jgi:sugar-specific transcriptional regulator TrmB